jgi:dienelactone hydrolase
VTDVQDRPMRRSTLMDLVFTFTGDLCAPATDLANCTSRIPGVANADAAGLQRLRASVGPALDALGLRDCSGGATCAVLAYTVKTQTVKDVSVLLSAAPYGIESTAGAAVFTPSGTAAFDPASVGIPMTEFGSVAGFLRTTFPTLYAIDGSTGAFDPGFASWGPEEIQARLRPLGAIVAAPTPAATASYPSCGPGGALKCVPLVVFQHGIGGAATQMLPIADALTARGFVVAAIDLPYHGERSYCTANDQCVQENGSDGVCTPDPSLQTPSDAAAPGTCTTGSLRPGDNLRPVASGNFFVSSNFFRIRDGIRQGLIDHSAATLALARAPAGMPQPQANDFATSLAALGVAIDPTQVYFSGLSLGANFGTSIVATNPRYSRAGLTATGATLVDVYTTGPANRAGLLPVFASLGIDLTKVSPVLEDGSPNAAFDPAQAARFAQTTAIAKWILDPAESINYAANITTKSFHPDLAPLVAGGLGSATTAAYGQLVAGDQRYPGATGRFLFASAGVPFTTYTSAGAIELPDRHELLLRNFLDPTAPRQQAGDVLRADLASFLATGTVPPAAQTIP